MIHIVILSLLFGITLCQDCAPPKQTGLVRANQFVSRPRNGIPRERPPSHLLAAATEVEGFDLFYAVEGMFLSAPTQECGADCTLKISALRFENETFEATLMVRDDELDRFPDYHVLPSTPLYCAKAKGVCGASIALFEFDSDEFDDHYVNTDLESTEPSYVARANGRPLCFLWGADEVAPDNTAQYSTIQYSTSALPLTDSDTDGDDSTEESSWPAWKIAVVTVAAVLGILLLIAIVVIDACGFGCWKRREPSTVNPYPRVFSVPQTPPRPVAVPRRPPLAMSTQEPSDQQSLENEIFPPNTPNERK